MDLRLDILIGLAKPTPGHSSQSRYYKRLVGKLEALYNERQKLKRFVDDYIKLTHEGSNNKMTIGRKIVYLEQKAAELEDVLYKIGYGEDGMEWPSDFEWSVCEEVIEACYDYLLTKAGHLLNKYRLLVFEEQCFVFQTTEPPVTSMN